MAHEWDSYFHNIPPMSSDSRTLRATSELEGSLSQHIEDFIGHHGFSNTVDSCEAPVTNSNFDSNCCPNPNDGNSSSECAYESCYRETEWHTGGQEVVTDDLRKCGDDDIPDFATNGLLSSGHLPPSFSTDLQGLKQDCEMLTKSFLEDYSDVSSSSDVDASETRPSCKFMVSNSVSKPEIEAATKQSPSKLLTHTENMSFPTEINVCLPSNENAKENILDCEQDKMKSHTAGTVHEWSSSTMAIPDSHIVEDGINDPGHQSHEQKEDIERGFMQGLLEFGMEENPDDKEEQITATSANVTAAFDKEQCQVVREEMNEVFDSPHSIDHQQRNMGQDDDDDKNAVLKSGKKELGSLTNLDAQKTPKPKVTISYQNKKESEYQMEIMETDCQEKEIQSNIPQIPDPPCVKATSHKEHSSTLENDSLVGSHLKELDQSSVAVAQNSICSSPAVASDGHLSDSNQQQIAASHSESCLKPKILSRDINSFLENECINAAERKNATLAPRADCSGPDVTKESPSIESSDKNQQNVAHNLESCLQTNNSSENVKPSFKKKSTKPEKKTNVSSTNPHCSNSATSDIVTTLDCSNMDTNPCVAGEKKDTQEKGTISEDSSGTTVTNDCSPANMCNKSKQSPNNLESFLLPDRPNNNMHPCKDKDLMNPADHSGPNTSPCLQESLHQSQVAIVTESSRMSFDEKETPHEQFLPGVLYGEPLSGEDSCDTDENKFDSKQYEETGVARPNNNSMNQSEGQRVPLKSSLHMRKRLQPVVVITKADFADAVNNSYQCGSCHHTTHSIDHLIEHHHCNHSGHSFQFCKTCSLYLVRNEYEEEHVCSETKKRPKLWSASSSSKKRKPRRCKKCGLLFSKLVHYVKHMRTHTGKTPYKCNGCGLYFAQNGSLRRHKRIPGRCKPTNLSSDAKSKESISKTELGSLDAEFKDIINKTESKSPDTKSKSIVNKTGGPAQKDKVEAKPYVNLPECYVKLVDISKINICYFCGKTFSTPEKAKKHYYNVHRGKSLAVSQNSFANSVKAVCSMKTVTSVETENIENETRSKYKCPLCPRLFKYSYNRARHLRDCVRDRIYYGKEKIGGKYRCPLCHATFTAPSNRYRHIKTSCLKECLNRLAKERAKSKETAEPKNGEIDQKKPSAENEHNKTSNDNEHKLSKDNDFKKLSKQNEQKPVQPLTLRKSIPHYKCNLCPAVFFHASGKYRHMKKHELFKLTGKMFKYRNSIFSTMSKLSTLSRTKTDKSADNSKSDDAKGTLSLGCHFCGKCFGTSQSLKKHERNHKGERPYRCLKCGKGFKKRAYLIGHKIVHQRRIQCTVCRKILPTIGELIQHSSSHHKKGKLKCPDCPLQFENAAHLLNHLDTHKNGENKALDHEEEPDQFLESVNEQSEPKELQCSLCKEVFNDAQVLRKHCLTHISGSSKCQCPFCKQNFSNRRYLLRHMIKHSGDKPFSCTHCGKQFYRHLYLKLHREKCLPSQLGALVTKESETKTKGPYLCTVCPRTFSKKIRLKSHLRGHKSNTLLLCSRCGQYFGFRKLNQHQRNCQGMPSLKIGSTSTHGSVYKTTSQQSRSSVEKLHPFKCPHCPRKFRFRSLYFRHLVSHTGLQPYECMHCGHRFGTQTMCLQHEAFCDGVYKEEQSKVKSDSATKSSVLPTTQVTAQKPPEDAETDYKCKFCTKTFMKPRNLRRHILTHNEVKPYRCKACDSCFSRYDYLKVHQARCRGKRSRLQICIPKISLDDVGRGWQNKLLTGSEPVQVQETFECEVCSRNFPTQSRLSRHFTMFHVTKLFKCARCGSSFAHEKSLKKHRKMRKCRKTTSETNISLPLENPQAENEAKPLHAVRNRVLHRIQPYFNKKYKYVCNYCPRAFGNSWQLDVHTRLHTGEKPYVCDYCGQRFIRKDYLQRHFLKCTMKQKQNEVLCERCGESFTKTKFENHNKVCALPPSPSKSTVSQQTTSESQTKGFSCAYCSSRFFLFSQLQEHFLNAHKLETMDPPVSTAPLQHHLSNIPNIKEEPLDDTYAKHVSDGANVICKLDRTLSEIPESLVCLRCNMSFANKAGLSGHLRMHSRTQPFNCRTCKKGFWNKSLLRNHTRKCRFAHFSVNTTTEVPVKAELDFSLTDSVLVFRDGSHTTGTGVLQTNFSCKDDLMDECSQNTDENEAQSSSSKERKVVQYQCSECDRSFTDGLMLISHLEDHGREEQEKKRNTCTKCGRVCSSQGNLEKHMKMHGITQKYSCPECPKMLYSQSDLEVHRTCHDPSRPFACKQCSYRFWTRQSLCNHYGEEHPNDAFSCRFCNKAYSVKKSLVRHYRKWHQKEQSDLEHTAQEKSSTEQQSSVTEDSDMDENNKTDDSDSDSAPYFPCHVCGKTFPTSESLEDHQRCHLGEKPHECAECGKCFFQASQLEQHQRMHKSEYQCQVCGRGFMSFFALRKHKHTHGKSRTYQCSKCQLFFTGPSQLAEHMSTHREENFPCDMCSLVFLSKSSRAEHRKKHSVSGNCLPPQISSEQPDASMSPSESTSAVVKDLKYRCGVCSDRFRDPEKLSEHGCIAAKERPYSCSDCDKHFLHASHLKKHRTTHQPSWSDKEYPCNQCKNSYSTFNDFLGHLHGHVGVVNASEKTKDGGSSYGFECPICNRCFASASELSFHFPKHSDDIFKCKTCKITFPSQGKLKGHERLHQASASQLKCADCGQCFLGNDALWQHLCSREQNAFSGNECSNPPVKKSPPTSHQNTTEEEEIDVTGEELYNCPTCAMQFSAKSSLLEHQNKVHQHEKPFQCKLCGKTFALRRYLREHERRHRLKLPERKTSKIAENNFKCPQCPSEFGIAQDLCLHMRMHAERQVGEFRCDMCYKSFSRWSLLKQHQESHVGQVVYECTECDKAFAFPHLLEEHQQTHAWSSQ